MLHEPKVACHNKHCYIGYFIDFGAPCALKILGADFVAFALGVENPNYATRLKGHLSSVSKMRKDSLPNDPVTFELIMPPPII